MSHKKSQMKSSKLSSTVLDYYYKYGQNRDLEKYLRLKQRNSSKSSSDSSLKNFESSNFTPESRRNTKSLEKLDWNDSEANTKESEHLASKGGGNVFGAHSGTKQTDTTDGKSQIKIEKKTQQQIKSKTKSKSYNFNLESSIEINLPSSTSMPIVSSQSTNTAPEEHKVLQLESCETQTEDFPLKQLVNLTEKSQPTPERATKITKLTPESAKQAEESVQETSPASSIASAKIRLEWDSMADIGYNRIIDFKSQSNRNLTTFEKSALTKFFAERGLNFDDNLLILASADSRSPLQKRNFTQSAIEMRDAHRIKKELPKISPTKNKQLWEKALAKYRNKYQNNDPKPEANTSKSEGTSGIDSKQFMSLSMAPHHSTPLTLNANNNSQLSDEHSHQIEANPVDESLKKPKVDTIEKWCQTSSVDVEAVGIQVEPPQVNLISKYVQIEIG